MNIIERKQTLNGKCIYISTDNRKINIIKTRSRE